jgi:hypothetical protein
VSAPANPARWEEPHREGARLEVCAAAARPRQSPGDARPVVVMSGACRYAVSLTALHFSTAS